jgi:hypothetical protein
MSREAIARCVGCACSDEKRCPGGCTWSRVDRYSRMGVCSRCATGKDAATLRATYDREVHKSRNLVATTEVA